MSKYSVYVETSVISYYTARRSRGLVAAAHREITCEWWDAALPKLAPYVSQIVIDEISRGDEDAARERLAAIAEFPILELTPEASILAGMYFDALRIPEKSRNDSLHLALATMNGMDYLVSWNCSHIASARVRVAVEAVNDLQGYGTPLICTPEELMEV